MKVKRAGVSLLTAFLLLGSPAAFAANESLDFLNRILAGVEYDTGKNVQRLSSGRLVLADDPAGYAVDQALEKYVRGLEREIRNAQDMVSCYTVEDGVLGSMIQSLQRIRELALQRTDGILSDDDRAVIEEEMGRQYDQILFVLSTAEFNQKPLVADLAGSDAVRGALATAQHYELASVDRLLSFLIQQRAIVGALAEGLRFSIQGRSVAAENMSAARAAQDADLASEISDLKRNQLLTLVNLLMLRQAGP